MNVALITDSFPPMIDGVSRSALGYAKALHEGGYGKSIVVAPLMPHVDYHYPFPVYGFRSVKLPFGDYRAGHPFMPILLKQMREMQIDIIHAHSPFISMSLACQLRRKLDVPVVFTQHTKWDYDFEAVIPTKLLRTRVERYVYWSMKKADELWAVSRGAGEHLQERGYVGDFIVMPNGTDFPQVERVPELRAQIDSRYNLPEGVPVFLFVGRMMWYKNISLILNTLEILKDSGFDFRMLFVGDGENLGDIKEMTSSKGLDDFVHFVGRVNDRRELMSFYERADLFMLLSVYDNAPLVVIEAAACSTPSIVLHGSATSEVVDDGVNGFHVSEESAEEAAELIKTIFSDRERLAEVSKAASEQVYMPWEKLIVRIVERYQHVIDEYKKKK